MTFYLTDCLDVSFEMANERFAQDYTVLNKITRMKNSLICLLMRTLFEVQPAVITQKKQLPQLGYHKFQLECKQKTGIDNTCNSFPSHAQH